MASRPRSEKHCDENKGRVRRASRVPRIAGPGRRFFLCRARSSLNRDTSACRSATGWGARNGAARRCEHEAGRVDLGSEWLARFHLARGRAQDLCRADAAYGRHRWQDDVSCDHERRHEDRASLAGSRAAKLIWRTNQERIRRRRFAVEDLSLQDSMKIRIVGMLTDTGLGGLRTLCYKARRGRRSWHVRVPLARCTDICPECNYVVLKLPLSVRNGACESCGAAHDRAVATALVILGGPTGQVMPEPAAEMPRKRGAAVRSGGAVKPRVVTASRLTNVMRAHGRTSKSNNPVFS